MQKIQKNIIRHANITGEDELRKAGKHLFGSKFRGVIARDELTVPRMLRSGESCILNLDKRNQPGSHWIAIVKDTEFITYDSFGRKLTNSRHTEDDAEQHIIEENCGQRCLAWLCVYYKYGGKCALMI